jgi:hypothetical protein
MGALAIVATVGLLALTTVTAQTPGASADAKVPRTVWGTPDLQGIWANMHVVPLERPAEFKDREFKSDADMIKVEQELIRAKETEGPGRDSRELPGGVSAIGTEKDVARAYNEWWFGETPTKPGRRTGQIVDPPDGKLPPLTAEFVRKRDEKRDYLQALLQGTSGGRPGPKSPRRSEPSPDYNLDRINRSDGPEDRGGPERCLGGAPPQPMDVGGIAGSFRIVQSNDSVAFYYDIGQGQGYSLVVPVTNTPHLPASVREYRGDPRGRWEGDTFVVDTTNFTQKTSFRGARENLHIVERYKRTSPTTLEYRLTVSDPTTWTKPWTLVQDLTLQDNKSNLVMEGACHEGNYGLLGMLINTRAAEKLFREGKGPDPDLQDNATGGGGD